jgi:hypothetical protein
MTDEMKPSTAIPPRPVAARWWWAIVAGVVLAVPFGWLLSYAAALLAMVGLFFFMLFGLVIGAVMYRIGQAARPVPRWKLKLGVALVVFVGWTVSIAVEARDFPSDVAKRALKTKVFRQRPGQTREDPGRPPQEITEEIVGHVRSHLRENYPPGGMIGYVRWAVTSSEFPIQVAGVPQTIRLHFNGNRGWWVVRSILSIVLFTFAVYSLVRVLRSPETKGGAGAAAPPDAPVSAESVSSEVA